MTQPTTNLPNQLYVYALRFRKKAEASGHGTQFPSFRRICRRFRIPVEDIEGLIYDYQGVGFMDMIVGVRVGGLGGGTAAYDSMYDYEVEACDD